MYGNISTFEGHLNGGFMGSLIKKRRKKMRKHKYKKYGKRMRATKK